MKLPDHLADLVGSVIVHIDAGAEGLAVGLKYDRCRIAIAKKCFQQGIKLRHHRDV